MTFFNGQHPSMKKIFPIFLCGVFFAAILYAVFGIPQKHVGKFVEAEKKDKIVLSFYGFKSGKKKVEEIESILHKYMDIHPGIVIQYEGNSTESYGRELAQRIESGNTDDIFMVPPSLLSTFADRGWIGSRLADLTATELPERYSPLVRQWITINDKIPALPMNLAVIGMLANMDILHKCGIKAVPLTYRDWVAAMNTIREKGFVPVVHYTGGDDSLMFIAAGRVHAPFVENNLPLQIRKDSLITVLAELKRDILPLGGPMYDSYKKALREFGEKGEAAFIMTPSWGLSYFRETNPQFAWQYTGLPLGDAGQLVDARASIPVAVNAQSPHRQAAIDFLKFLMQPEHIERYAKEQSALSPLQQTGSDAEPLYSDLLSLITRKRLFSDSSPEIPFNMVNELNKMTRALVTGE